MSPPTNKQQSKALDLDRLSNYHDQTDVNNVQTTPLMTALWGGCYFVLTLIAHALPPTVNSQLASALRFPWRHLDILTNCSLINHPVFYRHLLFQVTWDCVWWRSTLTEQCKKKKINKKNNRKSSIPPERMCWLTESSAFVAVWKV